MEKKETTSAAYEDFQLKAKEEAEFKSKEQVVKRNRVDYEYNRLQRQQQNQDKIEKIDFSKFSEDEVDKILKSYELEEKLFEQKKDFIGPMFRDIVPHGPGQVILVGGRSGEGKSTTCANLVLGCLKSGGKAVVISNEELPQDVLNRVTALSNGWPYGKGIKITETQSAKFKQMIPILSRKVRVIHNEYEDAINVTTSIEGIKTVLNRLKQTYLETGEFADTVIFDYYQNITISTENPKATSYQVHTMFYEFINQFRKTYPASFVILAQIRAPKKDQDGNAIEFKERIEGAKIIYNAATCALEMRTHKDKHMTEWSVRKHRWGDEVDRKILTGWEKGLYVEYTIDFMEKTDRLMIERLGRKNEGDSNGSK